jgi:hypothetical protein
LLENDFAEPDLIRVTYALPGHGAMVIPGMPKKQPLDKIITIGRLRAAFRGGRFFAGTVKHINVI